MIEIDAITGPDPDVYPDASAEKQDDGTLLVNNPDGFLIAMYSPQSWLRLRFTP
ncbi:hypothetical protein [Corynebacterium variabile]|uniref:hypothetical protein n=1 Tax=Corynebacterium variabile TaxID=1727 RepID=UPI003FD22DBD